MMPITTFLQSVNSNVIVEYSGFIGMSDQFDDDSTASLWFSLYYQKNDHSFVFQNIKAAEITIGRADKRRTFKPTVDLSGWDAYRLGVSRLHAMIKIEQESIRVVDGGGANGTFIDGKILAPKQFYPLEDGSLLRLGNMSFVVSITKQ